MDVTTIDGEPVPANQVTIANNAARSYAYCADTLFNLAIAEKIKDVTIIYHETTYLKELEQRAFERFHSTTVQAAEIARAANAQTLLIGHFSSKYEDLTLFEIEARQVFTNTHLAIEGVTYRII